MARKAVRSVELKDAEEGKVRAVIATLGVRDKDGDLIEPGAFGTQRVRVSGFNHTSWEGALPVGKGTVTESGDRAVADLQFFMDTTGGADAFRTIKGLGELGEWSFGFDITEEGSPDEEQRRNGVVRVLKGLEVHEVSPVLMGAGVGTGTLVAKCNGCDAPLQRRTRTRKPAPATPQVEELVAAAEGTGRRAAAARRFKEACKRRNPDAEAQSLALFTLKIGHRLAGSLDALAGRVEPPALKWFPFDGEAAGRMFPHDYTVYLRLGLQGKRLAQVVLHELRHFGQKNPKAPGAERDAEQFAERWSGAVAAAHRAADGDAFRVHLEDGRPPWYGHDGRRYTNGDVVLSRSDAEAYAYYPHRTLKAWGRLS